MHTHIWAFFTPTGMGEDTQCRKRFRQTGHRLLAFQQVWQSVCVAVAKHARSLLQHLLLLQATADRDAHQRVWVVVEDELRQVWTHSERMHRVWRKLETVVGEVAQFYRQAGLSARDLYVGPHSAYWWMRTVGALRTAYQREYPAHAWDVHTLTHRHTGAHFTHTFTHTCTYVYIYVCVFTWKTYVHQFT